jgi:hypothetical protein
MAVTYRRRKQAMPYKTRLTGRLMFLKKWGVRRNTPDPSPFCARFYWVSENGTYIGTYNPSRPDL